MNDAKPNRVPQGFQDPRPLFREIGVEGKIVETHDRISFHQENTSGREPIYISKSEYANTRIPV